MKYNVIQHGAIDNITIVTENGGVAAFYHGSQGYVTDYYHAPLEHPVIRQGLSRGGYVWDELSQFDISYKEWDGDPAVSEVIADALQWLILPAPAEGWAYDETLFADIEWGTGSDSGNLTTGGTTGEDPEEKYWRNVQAWNERHSDSSDWD